MARRGSALKGRVAVPGDKSISHRALILGAMAVGETRISGLLEADDVMRTAAAMRELGADIVHEKGEWRVHGVGVGGFAEPSRVLDFANSATGCRLSMGAMATTPIKVAFTGDASLQRRPMKRVLEPLELFGASWSGANDGLPLTIEGAANPLPAEYDLPVASAQVKSAFLLAALNAPGRSTLIARAPTRDHTERLLRAFGVEVRVEKLPASGEAISLVGEAELRPAAVGVPGDPSAAAFPLVAALIVPDSDIVIEGVMLNPRRMGLIETLKEMGAHIEVMQMREEDGETVGDLRVRASSLRGIEVAPKRATVMIDEIPVLAVAAALASGRTVMRGLKELRYKESDRLAAVAAGLKACGVKVEASDDGLAIDGNAAGGVPGGAMVRTEMDHRIAMSFLVLGMGSREPVQIDDSSMIATSFPDFVQLVRGLGATIEGGKP